MMRGLAARYAAFDMMEAVRALSALLLLGMATIVFPHSLRAATFSGGYDGIGDAAGMSLTLSQIERRVVGSLSLQGGAVYTLNGEREDAQSGTAQGALSARGGQRDAFFHIEERPLGLQLLFIPATAEGEPDLGRASEYSFLKRGVRPTVTEEASPRYKVAPEEPVDILAFIDGFRGWSPRDTARLYAGLPERQRALILLYDHATAELMWRICEAAPEEGSIAARRLAELQERQQTDCESYLRVVERAKKGGLFSEFLRRSQFQLELIRATVLCDRGETGAARCADVSALGSPLILRWRRADAIMRELAGADAEPDVHENAREPEAAAEREAGETSLVPAAEAETVPQLAPGAPIPLPRPGGGEEGVSDFGPDALPLAAETVEQYRLPLARP
ncbi:MAG: hypothetical protein AMXMBFR74_18780 [Parvibaculum sp.]|uniref:hypothetical protein n=1 Tax=Parvibaculum sp. TaxID=2024848 RepID=UPI0035B89732